MIEFDPSKNLEMSQETLADAWQDLAQALILRSDHVEPLISELPPYSGSAHPYQYLVQLPEAFAREVLLEEDDIAHSARAIYIMEHRVDDDPEYIETYESVIVQWSNLLPGAKIKADHSITINCVREFEQLQYVATTFVEYTELHEGRWRRVSPSGFDAGDTSELVPESDEWYERIARSLEDFSISEGTVTLSEIEVLHKIAEYIRNDPQ